ncbi:MAG TPA: hypothetical protein VMZ92_18005 [Planctomycetota bacterium]|nr:hypothetical protein [Planctomycetota bacterium]
MADTRIQRAVEDWVRRNWMPQQYGVDFFRERVTLTSGGVFDFDAVSADRSIVANISTSSATTASGKLGVGKLTKIRSDIYFLLLAEAKRRIMVLTDRTMYERCMKEAEAGRVPDSIEFAHAEIPEELAAKLHEAKSRASKEVSPPQPTSNGV